MRKSIFVFALAALLAAGEVTAQAPRNFSYQGMLLDAAKVPVSGLHTITVKLYDTPLEGMAIHSESFTSMLSNGVFSVVIGSNTALDASVTFTKQYWLGVSVDGGPEMMPRTALTSVPYANALTTGAVTSINNANGDLTIVGGKGLNVVTNGNTITLNSMFGAGGKQDPQSDVVHSITGTENQVLVDGTYGTQIHDDLTLTLPQDIHTGATPTFAGMTLTDLDDGSTSNEVVVSNDGVLETRTLESLGGGVSGTNPFITFAEDEGDLENNRVLTAGNGISITDDDEDDDGTLTVSNTGVLSITGTANQVNADVSTGDVTLSLPQDIDGSASPTFAGMTLSNFSTGVVHSDGSGVLSSSEVVYGDIQDVSAARLLGNPSGAPATMSEISLGYGLQFNGSSLETYSFAMGNEPFLTFTADLGSLTDNRVLGNSDGSLTLTIGGADNDAADIILNTAHANSWTATQTFSDVDINGGTINGTTIGGAVPADGTFANLTVNGTSNLKGNISSSVDDLDITDDVQITGSLNVNTNTDLDGTLNVDGTSSLNGAVSSAVDDLDIADDVQITGSLNVNTNTDLDGTLNVDGAATHQSTLDQKGNLFSSVDDLDITDDVQITGNLNVNTNTDLDGTLNVDGAATHQSTLDQKGNLFSSVDDLDITDDVQITGSLNVNTNTDLDGTLNVDGAATHQSTLDQKGNLFSSVDDLDITDDVEITGSLDVNTNLNIDGASSLNGPVSSAVDDLDLVDDVQITGNLNVTINTDLDGTLNVDGAVTHQSTLDQKGNLFSTVDDLDITDDVQITGSLNVNTNTDLDGTLNVDGATTLNASVSSNSDDLDITDDVEVTGSVDINTNLNVDGTSSLNGAVSSAVDDLDITDDVQITGSLNVNTNTDLDGTLNVDGAATHQSTLDQKGNLFSTVDDLDITDDVQITGSLNVNTNTDLDGTLNVDGATTLNASVSSNIDDLDITDDVEVTGSVDINTNLNVDGTSSLNGAVSSAVDDLDITDDVQITGNLNVNGNTDFDGTLNVDGAATLNGPISSLVDDLDLVDDVQITGNLNVNTNTDLDGTLNVDGAATHQSTLDQKGNLFSSVDDLDIADDVEITGSLDVNTNLNIDGTSSLNGAVSSAIDDLDLVDDVQITGNLNVTINTDLDGTLNVDGAATHQSTLDQKGNLFSSVDDLDIADDVEITGSLDVNTNLNVDGSTIHVGTLDQRGAVANSAGNLWLNDEVDVTGSVVPTADNTYNLGSDIKRWKNAYIDGASVHIGPTGGSAGSTEMTLAYAGGTGSINIDNGTTEFTLSTSKAGFTNTNVWLANNDAAARELRLYESSAAGTNYTAFKSQAQAADITYTLPPDDGGADDVLLTDGTGNLSWGQITTAEIALNTILANDIATGAVETDEILNETITVNDIGPNAVGNSEMLDNAVGNAEMLDNAIGNAEMLDNAIGNAEMLDNAIGNAEMADNAIGNAEMADNAIGNAEMADNAIGSNEIIDNSVTAADLADATISYADIQNVTNNRLLGRSNGSDGPMHEITIGAGLTLSGGQLSSQGNVLQGDDVTVVANAATVDATGITGVRVLSDNNPNSDALTITGGVNGQTLHIWYETTGNGDVVVLGKTITVTNGGPGAGIILLKINGSWRLMGSFDN